MEGGSRQKTDDGRRYRHEKQKMAAETEGGGRRGALPAADGSQSQ